MKYLYSAYNLAIQSPFPLPELISTKKKPHAFLRLEKLDVSQSEAISEGIDFRVTAEGVFLFWKKEASCFIRKGKEIIIDPYPGVDERVLRLIALGPALAILLYQRGHLPLHAAAVEIDGQAVCFMGSPGCGKSPLAAALYDRGHKIVADDVTAVQLDGSDGPWVTPGFPQLKLWPEMITALGENPRQLPCIEPGTEKRSLIPSRFSNKPAPLKKIYLLNSEQTRNTTLLSPQDALIEVIRHSYRAPLLRWIEAQRHLHQCARLANTVPIRILKGSFSPPSFADAARMVEDDLTA